jgi:photosystem II stability/assembly factor-like uncharacterized protein
MVLSLAAGRDGTVYLGTLDGHVFVSQGAAGRWELAGRVGQRTDAVISRLVSDPREASRLYAAVWYQDIAAGGGVFQSEDQGKTWKAAGLAGEAVRALELIAAQPGALIAGTRSGVFRSHDAGKTWERISPQGDAELQNVDSLAVDPANPNVIYVGTYHLPWKTIDGGKSWKPVAAGLIDDSDIMSLRVDILNPARLYLSACSGIYRSENEGAAWTKLQGIPYAARRTHAIVQDEQNPQTLYAATTEGLWVTHDAGENWNRGTPKDWVVNSVVVLAEPGHDHGRVVLGTEAQGVLTSEDAGATFTPANRGFTHQIVKELTGEPRDASHLMMLLERGGRQLLESRDAGLSWTPMPLLAEQSGKPAKLNPELVQEIHASPWGWLARMKSGALLLWQESTQRWKEWKVRPLSGGGNSSARGQAMKIPRTGQAIVGTSSLAFSNEHLFVATREGVLGCTLAGECRSLPAFARNASASVLWSAGDGSVIGVVAAGRLGISRDAGATANWQGLPDAGREPLWIDVDVSDGKTKIFLGTTSGLYESSGNTEHWQRVEAGLPAGQVEKWLRRENFMMATLREGGVYFSHDAAKTWTRLDSDAQRGRTAGLVAIEHGNVLVGSQSEGILRFELDAPANR